MRVKYLEHIGIAVKNLEESIKFYEEVLGLKCYSVEDIEDQKVRAAFFKVGEIKIELMESTDEESAVAKFIQKKGEGLHHLAFAVNGLEEQLQEIASKHVDVIDIKPKKGPEGYHVAFLHPKSTHGVLTELCENKMMNYSIS